LAKKLGESLKMKALVIIPNEKTRDLGDLLAIARAESQKREGTPDKMVIRAVEFVPSLGVYVAVYEASDVRGFREKLRHG
jgi:hypothetical protein